jgi:hypothetical protein
MTGYVPTEQVVGCQLKIQYGVVRCMQLEIRCYVLP